MINLVLITLVGVLIVLASYIGYVKWANRSYFYCVSELEVSLMTLFFYALRLIGVFISSLGTAMIIYKVLFGV